MKILTTAQIRQADQYTIEHEPISSADLMERAATQVFEWLLAHVNKDREINIFCGIGNNGGDGLVVARRLSEVGFDVNVYLVGNRHCEEERRSNPLGCFATLEMTKVEDFPAIKENSVIVDALFGSGLNRPVEGLAGELIEYLNRQQAIRVAIDISSGLFADRPSPKGAIFQADYTLTFQQPKLAFLMPENDVFTGQLVILDIKLHPQFLDEVTTNNFLVDKKLIVDMIHRRPRFSHKGTYGHALLIAGSEDKPGAAILASKSCMRTGVGLLSVALPKSAWTPLQVALPEAMLHDAKHLDPFSAIGIGPGLGKSDEAQRMVKHVIQDAKVPLVMDADALNILSENKTWLSFLPAKTILTPHPKEFERLFGKTSTSFERLELQREMAVKYGIIIVLKGAYTATAMPNGTVFFNNTGNPGMATAGSGDVLTGMILSLLAQRYTPEEAAVLGVYLHGLAGDFAVDAFSQEAMIASDITNNIGKAFSSITGPQGQ